MNLLSLFTLYAMFIVQTPLPQALFLILNKSLEAGEGIHNSLIQCLVYSLTKCTEISMDMMVLIY